MDEELTPEMMEALEEEQEDTGEDGEYDRLQLSQELQEAYGAPEPDEKINQHAFIDKAAFKSKDTIRTTFLTESELGRPLFNVRFLSDMEDVVKSYIDEMAERIFGTKDANAIAFYFLEKRRNVTESGMSNKGFAMNLNVTRRMDTTRKRVKELPPQMKGGGK